MKTLPVAIQRTPIGAFVFNSPGGNIREAKRLAVAIRNADEHPNTGVAAGGECASACVLLWAAGAHKSVAPDAIIGVHRTSLPTELVQADPDGTRRVANDVNVMLANDLASVGALATVVAAAVTTSATWIYVLTLAEYAAWNVHVTDFERQRLRLAGCQ